MENRRNKYGVKNGEDTYRTINGIVYQQFTDDGGLTLQDSKKRIRQFQLEYPRYHFITIRQKEGYYRIYRIVDNCY